MRSGGGRRRRFPCCTYRSSRPSRPMRTRQPITHPLAMQKIVFLLTAPRSPRRYAFVGPRSTTSWSNTCTRVRRRWHLGSPVPRSPSSTRCGWTRASCSAPGSAPRRCRRNRYRLRRQGILPATRDRGREHPRVRDPHGAGARVRPDPRAAAEHRCLPRRRDRRERGSARASSASSRIRSPTSRVRAWASSAKAYSDSASPISPRHSA